MKIIDEDGKEREIVDGSLKTVTYHDEVDENGKPHPLWQIEYIVVGKTHQWKSWTRLDKFRELNPTVSI